MIYSHNKTNEKH